MTHYKIITDETKLDDFINFLPDTNDNEVFYLTLFGRHKYCPSFPNTKDAGQLARIFAKKSDLKEKIRRLETPIGSYSRDNVTAPQDALATYIGLNPRNLTKANKNLLIQLANRFAENDTNFNPLSVVNTEVHRATDRKFFVDFDYDTDVLPNIDDILPKNAYRILKTRGGFHVIVELQKVNKKQDWYSKLAKLPHCDVKGANNLTPIPGCIQGNFTPYFL